MLRLSHISKHFGSTHALDDVSFDVHGGEVHALLGENGAGKSTLMRIAYGMMTPDSGEIVTGRGTSVVRRARLDSPLASDARVLLLDEPTAVLAPREVEELLHLVRAFRDQGGAVVLISHKLAEVARVADRVTVLRRGKVTLSGAASDHDAAALSRAMIGDDPALDRPAMERRALRDAGSGQADAVRVELLGVALHAGEIVGVAAIEGNGQRELLRGIGGVGGRPHHARVHGSVVLVPEDRGHEGLLPALSLTANYLLGQLDRAPRWLDWPKLARETTALIEQYDVRGGDADSKAAALSGGNQQKFILGRALERHPDVLVVEHPTRGLDLLATAAIHRALRRAADRGACVVIHSSDLDEVLAISDRLLVVSNGVVRELPIGTPRDAVGDAMLGLA